MTTLDFDTMKEAQAFISGLEFYASFTGEWDGAYPKAAEPRQIENKFVVDIEVVDPWATINSLLEDEQG